MIISDRLNAVCNITDKGNTVADIGCDHGYVCISLIERDKFKRALAMDVNKGPLARAHDNINSHHLENCIETRLSNGLAALKKDEADTIIISGMGGMLTVDILDAFPDKLSSLHQLVLCPHSEPDKVREYIISHGFCIADEKAVFENGKYYQIIKALKGESPALTTEELFYGPVLLSSGDSIIAEYIVKEHNKYIELNKHLTDIYINEGKGSEKDLEALKYKIRITEKGLCRIKNI